MSDTAPAAIALDTDDILTAIKEYVETRDLLPIRATNLKILTARIDGPGFEYIDGSDLKFIVLAD